MVDSDAAPRRPAGRPRHRGGRLLEILGLWGLAVVLPLTGLVGANAPFLLHHRPDAPALAAWLAIVALGAPLAAWALVEGVARLRGVDVARRVHSVVMALLLAALALGLLRRSGDPLPVWLLPPLVAGTVWLGGALFRRSRAARWTCAVLGLSLPIAALSFWLSPAATAARATTGGLAATPAPALDPLALDPGALDPGVDPGPPIVLLVFDELPLVSILDAELGIDADHCPHLAAFAREATWYRNASTVWSMTNPSIVSILTGREAERRRPPTRASHPENLLTWLDATHDVHAFERSTAMAPAHSGPGDRSRGSGRAPLWGLLSDSTVVGLHQLLPPELSGWLPPIGGRWGDFVDERVVRARSSGPAEPTGAPAERVPWAFALGDARSAEFESFLAALGRAERPGLYFLHAMLPHMPFRYLPSGRVYGGRPVYQRAATAWEENQWFALETYQRHLLQVGYVDRLVGRLTARLRALELWEDALVVVTSDHGASHWPGQDRRLPLETEHPDDILRVPLLVKLPGQASGRVDDRLATTADIVPTIAAALGRPLPWTATGRSLLAAPAETGPGGPPRERRLHHPGAERADAGPLVASGELAPDRASLERKLELFDPSAGELRWVRFGPYRELLGRSVAELAVSPAARDCGAELDQAPALADWDPGGRYSPSFLTGALSCADLPEGAFVVAAINGRLAGSAAVQRARGGRGLFAVMTPESLLAPGANDVALYLAWGAPVEVRLEPISLSPGLSPG